MTQSQNDLLMAAHREAQIAVRKARNLAENFGHPAAADYHCLAGGMSEVGAAHSDGTYEANGAPILNGAQEADDAMESFDDQRADDGMNANGRNGSDDLDPDDLDVIGQDDDDDLEPNPAASDIEETSLGLGVTDGSNPDTLGRGAVAGEGLMSMNRATREKKARERRERAVAKRAIAEALRVRPNLRESAQVAIGKTAILASRKAANAGRSIARASTFRESFRSDDSNFVEPIGARPSMPRRLKLDVGL